MNRNFFPLIFTLLTFPILSETVTDRLSIVTDFKVRPSFYATESPFLVDRNALVYLGKTMNSDIVGIHLYEIKSKKKIFLTPPIREYFTKHSELLVPGALNFKDEPLSVYISDLLFLDRTTGKAGFHIEHSHFKLSEKKYFFAVWDINSNEIEFIKEIYTRNASNENSYSIAGNIGFDPHEEAGYFSYGIDANMKEKGVDDVNIRIFRYKNGSLDELHSYFTKWFPYNSIFHFEKGKILIQSYSEIHESPKPEGRIFDIKSSQFVQVSIPVVSYGAVFSKDGEKIYLTSAQTGEIQVLDTNTGKILKKGKLGTHGHTMGFWKESELLWVRNSGIHIYDPVTLKQKKVIPTSKFFKGHVNVSGSFVIPYDSVLVRNGFEGPDGAAGMLFLSPD